MKNLTATKIYALAFGLFLGLCIWKFGNPVILDRKITAPVSAAEFWNEPWPTHWANWIFLPLAIAGAILILQKKSFGRNPGGSGFCQSHGSAGSSFPQPEPWMPN